MGFRLNLNGYEYFMRISSWEHHCIRGHITLTSGFGDRTTMGILSFFNRSSHRSDDQEPPCPCTVTVDLGMFWIGSTPLGVPPSPSDPFYRALVKGTTFQPKEQGIELGTEDGVLDYGFFSLDSYRGSFVRRGQPLALNGTTSEADIRRIFGEPYWIDRSDGEIIIFYEYGEGTIELQFEFPDAQGLGFITLARNGVLSDPGSRKSYGVDKPWPPR